MKLTTVPLLRFLLTVVASVLAFAGAFLFIGWPSVTPGTEYGTTFSRPYARELGLDPDRTLEVALDDIGIRRFRIPAYWGLLESKEGIWDFSELDKDIAEIGKRNGKVILAIGEKLPRWPECWGPEWWKKLPRDQQRKFTLKYLETIVTHERNNPTIVAWQIENEPLFSYGDCPAPDAKFLEQETFFVRGLDPTREITTTDSGELSFWTSFGSSIDRLGVSVYRVVRNPFWGNFNIRYWFIPPYFYERKAMLLKPFGVKDIYVSEFQMEPWSNKKLTETPVADQLSSIDIGQFKSNFSFAERMGVPAVDFWGFEWWEWMRERQGHPEFIDAARRFFQSH
jgi:hypothetical protein